MRTIKELIKCTLLLTAGCFIGCVVMSNHRSLQSQKDLEVAKVLSDVCRYSLDCIEETGDLGGGTFEDIFYDIVTNLDTDSNLHITQEDVMSHRYCYSY